jgi:hypothetical protein
MTGEVVYFFAFDVANEILEAGVRAKLGNRVSEFGWPAKHTAPRDLALPRPLTVTPRCEPVELAGRAVRTEVRLYQFGVVSLIMRAEFDKPRLRDLAPYHRPVLADSRRLEDLARKLCLEICAEIDAFLVRKSAPTEPEAYTCFCIYELGPETDLPRWLGEQRAETAALLTDLDPAALSPAQLDEVFRLQRSLAKSDVVVIDWDAALLVDMTRDSEDTLHAIELANVQLEEFRHMDALLDQFLDRAYDDLERRTFSLLGISSGVLRKLRWFRVDLAKLADEVTNTTKFFGDWFLARVYMAARERFHLDQWKNSVEQRLLQLDQIYNVVHSEIAERRMFWLEIVVVVLIAMDLLAILLRR